MKASNTARAQARISFGWLLAALLGGCDSEPIVQLSATLPVRDAGTPPVAGRNAFSEWESFECEEIDPVCGADNQTYQNFCLARRAGVMIIKRGVC